MLSTVVLVSLLTLTEEPKLVVRKAQPYVAIRTVAKIEDLKIVLPKLFPEVDGWLRSQGLRPSGPPLIRYRTIDMKNGLGIEVGFPVAKRLRGNGRIVGDALPAGRYVRLYHYGGDLMAANGVLQAWAEKRGLKGKMDGLKWYSRAELYPVDPGDTSDVSKWETEILYMVR